MTKQQIEHLAELSKLEYSEQEMAQLGKEFDGILKFVSQVQNAKIDAQTVITKIKFEDLRDDNVRESLDREALLSNAPARDSQCFIVPKVVE